MFLHANPLKAQLAGITSRLFRSRVPATSPLRIAHPRNPHFLDSSNHSFVEKVKEIGIWSENEPLRLHLGCGQVGFEGYINIDYPPDYHSVMTCTEADIYADITKLKLDKDKVDEIRLHHVFEHFSRIESLLLLMEWHTWLKGSGLLVLEVPDFEENSRMFISKKNYLVRSGIVRHLVGDQSSDWGYHLEQWWPERLRDTLTKLGFKVHSIEKSAWKSSPYLSNCTAVASPDKLITAEERLRSACQLLRNSLVNNTEEKTYLKWEEELMAGYHKTR